MYDIASTVSRVANETYSHSRRIMPEQPWWDNLLRTAGASLLGDHWDRCHIHWFPGNHLIHLDKGKYLKEMSRFMKEIKFD